MNFGKLWMIQFMFNFHERLPSEGDVMVLDRNLCVMVRSAKALTRQATPKNVLWAGCLCFLETPRGILETEDAAGGD